MIKNIFFSIFMAQVQTFKLIAFLHFEPAAILRSQNFKVVFFFYSKLYAHFVAMIFYREI